MGWNAPGHNRLNLCGLKARAKCLIPNKPLVELHPILRKHHAHLGLEISPLMVRSLRIDVPHQCRPIAQADRKNCVTALPAELRKFRALRLDPFRRRDLQSLDHSRNRFSPREEKRDMNVIGNTANTNADIFRSIENRGQVGLHLGPDYIIQKWTPVLGTKHKMHKNVRKGLGHKGEYNASFQPASATSNLTWGFAPGYETSGLQPGTLPTIAALANDMPTPQARTLLPLKKNNMPIPSIQNAEPAQSGLKARTTLAWGSAPGHNRPTLSGLKARATLAWGNAPGHSLLAQSGLKARATLAWGNAPGHSRLAQSGLKARATLAWGIAPGHNRPTIRGLKARAKSLIRNLCIAAALLLLICGVPSFAQTQSPPLHIRVINAQTNKPIPNERLNVALKVDQIGSVAMPTDKSGIILVNYGNATIIRILGNMYADCRPRAELYTNYPIDTILKTGITTGNLCSSASPKAKPGELILYEIPKSYIPTYPAPPNSNLPHSDENPHAPQTNH
jgi:hypothetical protein